jgi:hypothetical protein
VKYTWPVFKHAIRFSNKFFMECIRSIQLDHNTELCRPFDHIDYLNDIIQSDIFGHSGNGFNMKHIQILEAAVNKL